MYGYNQPVSGNYYMGISGQNGISTPNPANYNYPKMMRLRGSQYDNYPKFKDKSESDQKHSETSDLSKELEKQIKELQSLTKEAKELAKKKMMDNTQNKSFAFLQVNSDSELATNEGTFSGQIKKNLKKTNLEEVNEFLK